MSSQQYCLRWNNHQPNFISVFSSLLNSECLVDVTLAAEGKYIQAHKVVLSACSIYFQELFSVNPCQHPIVILKDILFKDLKTVVDFMYYGEVNISQEQLQSVLKAAETLNIKGLADMPIATVKNKSSTDKRVSDSQTIFRRKRLKKSLSNNSCSGSTPNSSVEEVEILGPSHLTIKTEDSGEITKTTSDYSRENCFKNESQNDTGDTIGSIFNANDQNNSEIQTSTPLIKCEAAENVGSISVITGGKKRGRLLTRQSHIVAKSEPDGEENSDSELLLSSKRPFGRQYSDPTPQQNLPTDSTLLTENKSNLLTVPTFHLIKQNSDSVLPTQRDSRDSFQDDELRHSTIFQQKTQPRSNHCPMLRPGPALGCNFCWNTIDNHGRILRRKTKYHCPECRTNLCIVPCFQDYHNKKEDPEAENECTKEIIQKDVPVSADSCRASTIQKHKTTTSSV